jgi:hypothetical protein
VNTPDYAPKNGDFVAYIEELERRQLRSSQSPTRAPTDAEVGLGQVKSAAVMSADGATPAQLAASAAGVPSASVGVIVIGLLLVIVGALLQGGIFLIVFGIFLLWQALRPIIRDARAATRANRSRAMQQVTTLLSAHAERKNTQRK